MKSRVIVLSMVIAVILSFATCSQQSLGSSTKEKKKGEVLFAEDLDPNGGANIVAGTNDHADSRYFLHPDFYNMVSNDEITILPKFKTMQQTTEWSCAPSSAVMALNFLGVDRFSEWDAAVGMKANTDEDTEGALPGSADSWYEPGANIKKVVEFLNTISEVKVVEANYKESYTEADLVNDEDVNSLAYSPAMKGNFRKYFEAVSLYSSDNDVNTTNWVADAKDSYFVKWLTGHLKEGRPIITHTNLYNGHYVVIIGYDNMGTPTIGDDMLIMADPYDTWDHWQDGYVAVPLERFFYEWNDLNIAAKPYQLQPFVVVDKVE